MLENPDTASDISPNDLIGVVFGMVHPRRGTRGGSQTTHQFSIREKPRS